MGKATARGKVAESQKGPGQVGQKRGAAKKKRGGAAGRAVAKRKGTESGRETERGRGRGRGGGAGPKIRIKIGMGEATRVGEEEEEEEAEEEAMEEEREKTTRRNRRKLFRSVDYKRVGLDWPTSSPAIGSLAENERLRCAMRDLRLGKFRFVSRAAAYWRVHAAKLYRRHSGEVPLEARRGPRKVLTEADEEALIDWVVGAGRRGFPVAPGMVCDAVKRSFRKAGNPFTNDRPSHTWYHKFVRRHPRLQRGLRMSRLTAVCRADPTRAAISQWLLEFRRCLSELGLADKPGQIWTCGRTAFEMNRRTERIALTFARKAGKGAAADEYGDYEDPRQEVDVHVCASAAGELLPPFLVCKGFQGINKGCNVLEGAPQGSAKLLLDGQLETPDTFGYWIKNHLVPRMGNERPVLLLLDLEESEISYEAFAASAKHGVHLFRIPPQAVALLHPLEVVGEEGPLKTRWLTQWVKRNRHVPVSVKTVGRLIGEAWTLIAADPQAVRACFIQSGVYPLDREMVDDEHLPAGNLDFLEAVNQSDDEKDGYDEDPDAVGAAAAPIRDGGSSSLGKDLVVESQRLPEHKQPIAALLLFQELDDSLDKASRELYRACAESGIELGPEAPMFCVWRRLYTEAFKNDPNVPLTSVEEVVVTTSSSTAADPEEKTDSGRDTDPSAAEGSSEATVCPVCGEHFGEDDEEWIGCDGRCQQWFHVNCLPPELVTPAMLEEKEMFCPQCSKLRKDEEVQ